MTDKSHNSSLDDCFRSEKYLETNMTTIPPREEEFGGFNRISIDHSTPHIITTTKNLYHPLSAEAKRLHNEMYSNIITLLGRQFEQRSVFEYDYLDANGDSNKYLPIIRLHPIVSGLEGFNLEYMSFLVDNLSANATPDDFFRLILGHEYGHQIYGEFYRSHIDKIDSSNPIRYENLEDAVSEAFAFWFGEEISEMKHLNEDLANRYGEEERGFNRIDPIALKSIYAQLKAASQEHGTRYVLDNLVELAEGFIEGIDDVTLPRSRALELFGSLGQNAFRIPPAIIPGQEITIEDYIQKPAKIGKRRYDFEPAPVYYGISKD